MFPESAWKLLLPQSTHYTQTVSFKYSNQAVVIQFPDAS